MRTYLDCYPCFLRQTLATLRLTTGDEAEQKRIMGLVMAALPSLPLELTPPEISQTVYGIIARETGVADPYRELKYQSNREALLALPALMQQINHAPDRLRSAAALAINGNLIDFGVRHDGFQAAKELSCQQSNTFARDDFSLFQKQLAATSTLLYIGDNAGEIVADKIFITIMKELHPHLKIVFAVRESPIINDVTLDDARQVGMSEVARVISSGSHAPALLLEEMNSEMADWFAAASLVIAKGQGNYESLNHCDRSLFFLLQCKCQVVAEDLGVPAGSTIFAYHNPK
ncbi:MAG: DUF89 family protein [Deltaproteobacteria bacterium]|nr:DUF89 family protein [Candidatus Anaeroferrophillus wilburensis]MBN2888811.1 DUF89 family protein [Deltaproteobacteria bacterium]